jgi:hypothetical protein
MATEPHNHHDHDQHDHEHDHHDHPARISTAEERALLAPFVDDVHQFLRNALAGITGPVLEVGAGDGIIADRLRADGFNLVAIDSHAGTAAAATEQGRPVLHRDFRSWDGDDFGPFAAIVFTRSLHHIDPIEHALDQVVRLAPGGLFVAEEFGYELLDAAGAQLLIDAQSVAAAAGVSDGEVTAVADPAFAWNHRMDGHGVTPSNRMIDAIKTIADFEQLGHGRFVARMVAHALDPTHPQAAAVRDLMIATEDSRIAAGTLPAAGLRFVARVR